MKFRRTFTLLFLLPVLLAALIPLLINYWSLQSLRNKDQQNSAMTKIDVDLLTEAARLSESMAVVHKRVKKALEYSVAKGMDEQQMYVFHSRLVDELSALNKRVETLASNEQVLSLSRSDAKAMSALAKAYGNFVIMATDMSYLDIQHAIQLETEAQNHFISFSEHANRISAMLADRTALNNDESNIYLEEYFKQVMIIGLSGMVAMLALSIMSANVLSRRIADVAEGLSILADGKSVV